MQLRLVEYRRQDNSPARRARRRRQFLHDSLQRHGISVHERSVWYRQSGHAHRHADRERPVSGRAYFQRRPRLRTSDGMAQEKTEYHHHVKSLHRVFTTKSAKVTKNLAIYDSKLRALRITMLRNSRRLGKFFWWKDSGFRGLISGLRT